MKNKAYVETTIKEFDKANKNCHELNEEQSIDLLAEIIANRIIDKLLYDEKYEAAIEPDVATIGKKRKAA